MIATNELANKSLAIIAVDVNSNNDENVMVYSGIINQFDGKLFFNRNNADLFEITQWREELFIVKSEIKEILLNCDFALKLTVGNLSKDDNLTNFVKTGLKWME